MDTILLTELLYCNGKAIMKNATGYICAVLSAMVWGLLVFGGKILALAGLSLVEIMVIPNAIVALALSFVAWKHRSELTRIPVAIYALYVLVSIGGNLGTFAGLFMGVSVSIVLFCLYTLPVWNILLSKIVLKSKISKTEICVTVLIILGLLLLLAPWREATYSFWGIAISLLGGFCIALWVLVTSHLSKLGVVPITQTFIQNLLACTPIILAYPLFVKMFPDPTISAVTMHPLTVCVGIVAFSLSVMILAPMLFYKATQSVKPLHLGLILLLDPVVGVTLDITFLDTILTWNIAIGGLLIISVNAWLVLKRGRNVA